MYHRLLITILFFLTCQSLWSQDYFGDLQSGTTPVLFNSAEEALFSATINAGSDNSVKANFFRQYWTNPKNYNALAVPRHKNFWGWGLNTKVKVEDGLGNLFGKGEFNPGFTGGGYLSLSRMRWYNKDGEEVFGHSAIILSATLSTSKFQLYNPANSFDTQLSDTTFNGRSLSLSFVKSWFAGADNVFTGLSFTSSRKNNYSLLDKVDIKNDSIFNNSTGGTRIVQQIKDDGNIYAVGGYRKYKNLTIRGNLTYIPKKLNYFVAFIIYPSVDISDAFHPKYNIGFSLAHLVKDSPSTSDAALFLELNDLTNVADKDDPFFKRAFKFGISTTLNVFTSSR
jgi:hypothetical protein